jgi:hypothetical protein
LSRFFARLYVVVRPRNKQTNKQEKAMNEITKVCDLSAKPSGELSDNDLDQVAGGLNITPVPKSTAPKSGPPTSIAAGEVTTDTLDDNLPGNGGGVIV